MGFNKLFAEIGAAPVIAHTIRAFEQAGSVSDIIIVACEDRHAEIKKLTRDHNLTKVRTIIPGGERRQDSVRAGLTHLSADAKYLAVHDAARPLITPEQIDGFFEHRRMHDAAALAEH